ncbi:hypothetical protein RJG79_11150 [Mycoplasmatota bacterium WC44]
MKRNIFILNIIYTLIGISNGIGFYLKKDYNNLYGLVIFYVIYLFFLFLNNKLELNTKFYIFLFIVITIILHNGLGQYFNLYLSNNWFDKVLHSIGAFAFSQLFYFLLNSKYSVELPKIYMFISVFTIGITLGVFFEFGEFILDIIFKSKHQHSLIDTNVDLIFNTLGSSISGLYTMKKY